MLLKDNRWTKEYTYSFYRHLIKIIMKERYEVIKKLYPNYLILLIKNNKYYTFGEDKLIYTYINKNLNKYEINYMILDNLDIIVKKEYENNNYLNYYFKANLINILERRLLNEK